MDMKRLIAIALFIGALLFAFSGIMGMRARAHVPVEGLARYDEATLSWLFLLSAIACLAASIALWGQGPVDPGQPLVKGSPPPDPNKGAGGGLPRQES
jgi:hypothetical protein